MPSVLPKEDIEGAQAAVEHARAVRALHARRTTKDNPQREADIASALERLKDAMRPLRTHIGRFAYGPQGDFAEANRQAILDASALLQAERRKLWKMKRRKK